VLVLAGIKRSRKTLVMIVCGSLLTVAAFVAREMLFGVLYGPIVSVSVSNDGRYAISAHRSKELVLWNIETQTHNIVSENANLYSAYFVRGQDVFLWQDANDVVRVQTVDGEVIRQFEHFSTYGHVISDDLQTYIASDDKWNLFSGYGESLVPVLADGISPSFIGSGKLLNLSIARDKPLLVSAGVGNNKSALDQYSPIDPDRRFSKYKGVTLWSLGSLKPIAKLRGNTVKTHATISPDGQWVVSGDENGNLRFWNTNEPDEVHRGARDGLGVFQPGLPEGLNSLEYWDDSEIIDRPPGVPRPIFHVSFIDGSEYFLRFNNRSHQAALFKAGNPWPQKYFDLGKLPALVTYGSQYSRNTAIATAPEAGVLVMGHQSGGGINVYTFNAQNQTLERTWVVN